MYNTMTPRIDAKDVTKETMHTFAILQQSTIKGTDRAGHHPPPHN
jgi:hypothetical protein